jgi:hypothetical protein
MLAFKLELDQFDIRGIFEATTAQISTAQRRAIGKTIRWLSTRVSRELSQQFDVPQRVFQVRAKRSFDDVSGSLWVGLNPIAASWLGRARQTKLGVSVRSHRFGGAFIAKMHNGHIGIFQRSTDKALPIETVRAKLVEGTSADISAFLAGYEAQASQYYAKTFEHELNYILNKAAA